MRVLFSMIFFCLLVSVAAYSEQGTMSTDTTPAAQAPASISGTTEEEIDLSTVEREEKEAQEEKSDQDNNELFNVDEERLDNLEQQISE